jgi:tetratricopeptide (TPR) repeat protein
VFRAESISEAYRAHATEFLHTTFVKRGSVYQFESQMEHAASNRMTDVFTTHGNVLFAANAIARWINGAATPFSTQKEAALEAWGRGDAERAIEIDPDFGAAWISLVQRLTAAGNRTDAIRTADRALGRASLRSEWHRTQLQVTSANLRGDLAGSLDALNRLSQLAPADTSVLSILGDAEMASRQIEQAARHWRTAFAADPQNGSVLLKLGYAEAIAGHVEAARTVLLDYAKLPGQETNALDSLGEAYFMNGKFKESAEYFHQAYSRDATFLNGAPLYKAAHAEWLGGNLAGADATLAPYFAALASKKDGGDVLVEAIWLFTTGRQDQAIAKLSSSTAAQSDAAKQQLAVWRGQMNPPADERDLKRNYEQTAPAKDGMVRVFYASALIAAGKKQEAAELLKRWPLPDDGEPPFRSLVFPKYRQLRQTVGLQ